MLVFFIFQPPCFLSQLHQLNYRLILLSLLFLTFPLLIQFRENHHKHYFSLLDHSLNYTIHFFQVDSYDEKAAYKFLSGSEPVLEYVQRKLNKLEAWNEESIDHALQEAQTALSLPTPKLNQPIRIAMTGSTQSPSLGLTLSLFDLVEVNNRIDAALKHLAHST